MNVKLTNCSVCGAQIATDAKKCPQCGAKIKKTLLKKLVSFFSVIIIFLIVISLFSDSSETSDSPSGQELDNTQLSQSSVSSQSEKINYYQSLGKNIDSEFLITENAINFINEHEDLFPVAQGLENNTAEFIDSSITYAHLNKNISRYVNNLINRTGYVIDIEEASDSSATYVHIVDYDGNNYILYYLGVLDNVFDEMEVTACVLPLSLVTFENMSASYTEAVVCGAWFVNPLN